AVDLDVLARGRLVHDRCQERLVFPLRSIVAVELRWTQDGKRELRIRTEQLSELVTMPLRERIDAVESRALVKPGKDARYQDEVPGPGPDAGLAKPDDGESIDILGPDDVVETGASEARGGIDDDIEIAGKLDRVGCVQVEANVAALPAGRPHLGKLRNNRHQC